MIETKIKLWRTASAAALISVSAACSPPADESPVEPAAAVSGEAGEAAAGEGGGEHGEAGVEQAYAGIAGAERTALRLQQLKGFALIAQKVAESGAGPEAGVLVGQGLLEVYEPAKDDFGGLDPATLRAAESAGLDGKPAADLTRSLRGGVDAITHAQAELSFNHADVAARMLDISTGLYGHVIQPDFVDPIEYQHSLGAALAAKDALVSGRDGLRRQNASAYDEAMREIDRYIALWPGVTAPETPTANAQIVAQASRVRLALSAFL